MATNQRTASPATAGVPIIAGGVDWITCTAPAGHPADDLYRAGREWIAAEVEAGYRVAPSKIQGYQGIAAGGIAVGRRPDGVIVRASGSTAAMAWRDLLAVAQNVSRLDVQATIDAGPECDDLAWVHWLDLADAPPRRGRPLSGHVHLSNSTGQTFNLGSRSSEGYGRCYDKHAQEPKNYPPGAWRYEVEFKDTAASQVASRLFHAEAPTTAAVATCHNWFLSRGIEPLFYPPKGHVSTNGVRPDTTAERKLKWLERNVAGSVAWLTERVDPAIVVEALTHAIRPEVERTARRAAAERFTYPEWEPAPADEGTPPEVPEWVEPEWVKWPVGTGAAGAQRT